MYYFIQEYFFKSQESLATIVDFDTTDLEEAEVVDGDMVPDSAAVGGQKLAAAASANKPVNDNTKNTQKSNQAVTKTSNNETPKDTPKEDHVKIKTEIKDKDEKSPNTPPLPKSADDDKCLNDKASK